MDHNSHTLYFWRDGYLVRHPRSAYSLSFIDKGATDSIFIARSTNLTALIEFNDHVRQVMVGIRSLGLSEIKGGDPQS